MADCLGSDGAMRNICCAAGCSNLWNSDVGRGCCWNFDYRFHLFLGAVLVPHGIRMILFGSDKNNVSWAN